jgi:hypothetical protein
MDIASRQARSSARDGAVGRSDVLSRKRAEGHQRGVYVLNGGQNGRISRTTE